MAMVVSAGWYVVLVSLWPADSRPYIGGSTDNSLLQLALGHNVLSRILGGSGGGSGGGGGFGGRPGRPERVRADRRRALTTDHRGRAPARPRLGAHTDGIFDRTGVLTVQRTGDGYFGVINLVIDA